MMTARRPTKKPAKEPAWVAGANAMADEYRRETYGVEAGVCVSCEGEGRIYKDPYDKPNSPSMPCRICSGTGRSSWTPRDPPDDIDD